jgi:hypothetical protein
MIIVSLKNTFFLSTLKKQIILVCELKSFRSLIADVLLFDEFLENNVVPIFDFNQISALR